MNFRQGGADMKKFKELETKGQKVARVFFWISFVPAALLLLYGVYCAFAGFDFFGTSYGLEGFINAVLVMGLIFCVIPVFPICIIFQLVYLLWGKLKLKSVVRKKEFLWSVGVVLSVISLAVVWNFEKYSIIYHVDSISAQRMYKNAEDMVEYKKNVQHYGALMGIKELHNSCLMLDTDSMTLGIINVGDIERYSRMPFTKAENLDEAAEVLGIENYYLQSVVHFEKVDYNLYSFAVNISNSGITECCIIETADGEIWYSDCFDSFSDRINHNKAVYTSMNMIGDADVNKVLYGEFLERQTK